MERVTVLGAGAWGTALAVILARPGLAVTLCPRRSDHAELLGRTRENAGYLPSIRFPPSLTISADWRGAVRGRTTVVMAVPSGFARAAVLPLADALDRGATIISVTKGLERESLQTMTQMIAEIVPGAHDRVAALSGPGFAAEVARGKPAALVVAAANLDVARGVQTLFAQRPLRVYHSADVIGVELGGAIKNVIAIAAGISDGLELGSSARAALVTRGLAEMMRLAAAAGAQRETLAGLAGLGDLVLTCTGDLSRNRRLGLGLARGEPVSPPRAGEPVAEGVVNAEAINRLAGRRGVEMPLVRAVYRVLYEAAPANAMVEELLSRQLKAEF